MLVLLIPPLDVNDVVSYVKVLQSLWEYINSSGFCFKEILNVVLPTEIIS